MDSNLELSVLFDYYGSLLSETQQTVCDMYLNQNLSLSEISEDLGITKQGVRDALKKAEGLLYKYENALMLKIKDEKISCIVQEISNLLCNASMNERDKASIKACLEEINSLI